MCTLTILRDARNTLITMNRDDLIARAEAPPAFLGTGLAKIIAPLDLKAGGTWIGLNQHGLVACLLNRYDAAPPADARSRGAIVPHALATENAQSAIAAVQALNLSPYAPFTLVVISRVALIRLDWTGTQATTQTIENAALWMATSSSLSQTDVLAKRHQLLNETVQGQEEQVEALARFHTHSKPIDTWWSPWMARPNAHTKSVTQVSLQADGNRLAYWDRSAIELSGLVSFSKRLSFDDLERFHP
jgi:uncharacterized protein with NRDE domain